MTPERFEQPTLLCRRTMRQWSQNGLFVSSVTVDVGMCESIG